MTARPGKGVDVLRIGRREGLAASGITAGLAAVVGAAVLFGPGAPQSEPRPAGQEIVLDSAVRSTESSAPAEALSSSADPAAPGTVPAMNDQQQDGQQQGVQPAPAADDPGLDDPGPGLDDPTEPQPTQPAPTTPADEVTAVPPPPSEQCYMDDSDPVNFPNGREICVPI